MADGQQVEKKVTKLFVNGKPFMDGDTKLDPKISLRMQLIKCRKLQ
jgi:hypothetical protein